MDQMSATGLDADRADVLQALDQAEHGGGRAGLRHLPQPGQPALAGILTTARQGVEPAPLLRGKTLGQPMLRLAASVVAELGTKPLQRLGRGDDDPPLPAGLQHQPGQVGEAVVLDGLRQEPVHQLRGGASAERT